jgi:hypothetical protein
MISAVEALEEAYTPGNRAIKFFARLRKIDVIELACKFLAMPLLKNSRHELFAQLIASGTCSAAEAYRRSGGRTKNEDVIACRWLRKVSIKERIAELKGRAAEKCDMTREQTVRALAGIIQAKPSEASLERMAKNDVIVADWKARRFADIYPGLAIDVLDGDGKRGCGQHQTRTVRDSYADE